MTKYKYEGLEIVYKSGRKFYDFSYANRKRLSIDVLLKGEASPFPLRHIYIAEAHEFFSIVAAIAYYIQKTCEVPKPVAVFISNSPEIASMRRLVDLFSLKNVIIVSEKRSEEEMIIYQEEQ